MHAAGGAQPPDEALRGDEVQCGREVVRRDTDVEQPRDGGRCVVRVQRRQHEVAGLRGLDRDVGRLRIANLADHDDVRILPQERTQCGREREPGLFGDTDLADAVELDFGGILDRADVVRVAIEHLQRAVERQRLAAAGRTRDEYEAMRRAYRGLHRGCLLRVEAEAGEREVRWHGFQPPQHQLFTEQRR